jgi:hypothetical protein
MSNVANGALTKAGQAIFKPVMQGGFAVFSVLLLGVLTWVIYTNNQRFDKLLDTQRETNQVVERNTAAVNELSRLVERLK